MEGQLIFSVGVLVMALGYFVGASWVNKVFS